MKTLTINNLDKLKGKYLTIGGIQWSIAKTGETESGDGYNIVLLTEGLETSTVWVSREIMNEEWVKMVRRHGAHEWSGWADVQKMESPEDFIQELEAGVPWQLEYR